ncbi:MAG TPA: NUDIX domain-containing protein [Acidimicrobiales bacterium]|nr:NUDIX domain-containing protein [Acidimicrobiales bacterium]
MTLVRAGGGIVWRETHRGREVLLVHRSQRADWSLPKGHVKSGEEIVDAAVREVREETGYRVGPTQFADVFFYEADGEPKIVAFWHMALLAPRPDGPADHTAEWCTVEEALERLTHEQHRELLRTASERAVALPRGVEEARVPRWAGLYRRRLYGSLRSQSEELTLTASAASVRRDTDDSWITPALRLLAASAEAARRAHRQDEAWRCLHAARRLEVLGFEEAQVGAEAVRVRSEAEHKLGPWRRNAVLSVLAEMKAGDARGNRQRLAAALSVIDEHSGNEHHRRSLILRHLTAQAAVLLVALVAVVLFIGRSWITLEEPLRSHGWVVVAVAAAGAAGGAMSNVQRIGTASARGRVPEESLSLALAAVRPLVGAFAAVVVYVLLRLGILQFEDPKTGTAVALAFAAGFTERVFTGAIGTLTGESGGQAANARHRSA